ncbi:hypothetical protein [Rhodococcoides fascians]|uniref:hypothetical protein n=1 Tax=Rhodococcoides fascians TaxID=1828 RepID=UPI00056A4E8E|nr:hypothetical protein [Rhodococcus fascians]
MSVSALTTVMTPVLLVASATASIAPSTGRLPTRLPTWVPAATSVGLLAVAAVCASLTDPVHGFMLATTYVVTVAVAAVGGSGIVPAVFALARRNGTPGPDDSPGPLHGGRTIGILERTAVAASILSGWPEGIAIVLAVKGLARYPELRASEPSAQSPAATSASEQFIIGTFASVMWAVAVCGVGLALTT